MSRLLKIVQHLFKKNSLYCIIFNLTKIMDIKTWKINFNFFLNYEICDKYESCTLSLNENFLLVFTTRHFEEGLNYLSIFYGILSYEELLESMGCIMIRTKSKINNLNKNFYLILHRDNGEPALNIFGDIYVYEYFKNGLICRDNFVKIIKSNNLI